MIITDINGRFLFEDKRIYMFDEDDYEYEVDMALLDEVGYLAGVYTEGPRVGEEFILANKPEHDAIWRDKEQLKEEECDY